MRDHDSWRGYFAASPTPFDRSGELDLARLREVLAWFVAQGPHGLVVNGTTGEWVAQTVEERQRVLETARDVVPRELPLLAGIGSIRAQESIILGRHAAAAGADGVLLTIPPGRWLDEDEVFDFYVTMAKSIPLPILVYNVPIVAGKDLHPTLIARLLTIDGIVGVKDNTPSPQFRAQTLREADDSRAVFSDVLESGTFPIFALEQRGRGQIGSAMPLGPRLARAFELVWEGEFEAARVIVDEFTAFKAAVVEACGAAQPWHAQIKAVMYVSGVDAGYPRFPTRSVRDHKATMSRLAAVIDTYLE